MVNLIDLARDISDRDTYLKAAAGRGTPEQILDAWHYVNNFSLRAWLRFYRGEFRYGLFRNIDTGEIQAYPSRYDIPDARRWEFLANLDDPEFNEFNTVDDILNYAKENFCMEWYTLVIESEGEYITERVWASGFHDAATKAEEGNKVVLVIEGNVECFAP